MIVLKAYRTAFYFQSYFKTKDSCLSNTIKNIYLSTVRPHSFSNLYNSRFNCQAMIPKQYNRPISKSLAYFSVCYPFCTKDKQSTNMPSLQSVQKQYFQLLEDMEKLMSSKENIKNLIVKYQKLLNIQLKSLKFDNFNKEIRLKFQTFIPQFSKFYSQNSTYHQIYTIHQNFLEKLKITQYPTQILNAIHYQFKIINLFFSQSYFQIQKFGQAASFSYLIVVQNGNFDQKLELEYFRILVEAGSIISVYVGVVKRDFKVAFKDITKQFELIKILRQGNYDQNQLQYLWSRILYYYEYILYNSPKDLSQQSLQKIISIFDSLNFGNITSSLAKIYEDMSIQCLKLQNVPAFKKYFKKINQIVKFKNDNYEKQIYYKFGPQLLIHNQMELSQQCFKRYFESLRKTSKQQPSRLLRAYGLTGNLHQLIRPQHLTIALNYLIQAIKLLESLQFQNPNNKASQYLSQEIILLYSIGMCFDQIKNKGISLDESQYSQISNKIKIRFQKIKPYLNKLKGHQRRLFFLPIKYENPNKQLQNTYLRKYQSRFDQMAATKYEDIEFYKQRNS